MPPQDDPAPLPTPASPDPRAEARDAVTEAEARALVAEAARSYFAERRARIDDFVARTFGLRGTLGLHRHAVGWDLARAPANLALAPAAVLVRLGAAAARKAGARGAGDWLSRRRLILRTQVAREVERRVVVDLLELPWTEPGAPEPGRDALAEAILASPRLEALARLRGPEAAARLRASDTLAEYAGVRSAAAEITTGIATMGAGAAAFQQLTPGAISLGPALAGALAQQAAVSAFPLGATAGSLWYGVFPTAASPALVAGATAGMAAAGAVAAAFAGVIADPVQVKLGVHQRRLARLVDALEEEFLKGEGAGFAAREHYAARVLDLVDMGLGVVRHIRA
ncbi:hypothetical protein P2H44_24775 [Albimonas sp. CAU 1670]|uniref:DUF6635 family protein n=1 Tax=Albimonas sp. CAU 1670 TaxID=3032599 RepID=UPI0023DC5B4F|nr:DUF6635 family protein [Albimonas sp. CAU 1670]MDF2235780.1 hypothetical protein [Albimonas sp. CAU 1670]